MKNYVNTYGLDYTVGFDATSAVFHTYHAFGLPTQVFIDGNGVIRRSCTARSRARRRLYLLGRAAHPPQYAIARSDARLASLKLRILMMDCRLLGIAARARLCAAPRTR